MQHNEQEFEQALRGFFQAQLPTPFPKAPRVQGGFKARNFSGLSARVALAASMLILFGLGIMWPKNNQTASNINFKSAPASASDDKLMRTDDGKQEREQSMITKLVQSKPCLT